MTKTCEDCGKKHTEDTPVFTVACLYASRIWIKHVEATICDNCYSQREVDADKAEGI